VALRPHTPVVGVVAGLVGCFGGMSLAAALCSHLIATPQARLGMNGPEVIEQEAGVAELDSSDRRLIWSLIGGTQRAATGFVDTLVEDDADAIAKAIRAVFAAGVNAPARSEQVEVYAARIAAYDPSQPADPVAMRRTWSAGDAA
jgi:malonate decarboxylase beta subunit